MLKQIKLRNRKRMLEAQLEEVRKKKADFQKREEELGTALEEANTEEDMKAIEEEIDGLEKEMQEQDVEGKETSITEEIRKIEDDLKEIEEKAKGAGAQADGRGKDEKGMNRREENGRMRVRGVFKLMTRQQQEEFVQRAEVQEFVGKVRGLKGKQRSITGAELTIPTIVLDLIRDTLHQYSKLIGKVNLKPVAGKARQHVMGVVPEGIWTEAIGKLNELDFTINQIEMDGYKVGGFIPMHNSTLEDSDLNLAAEIIYMIGQAIGLAVDKAILYGTGQKMPLGIATRLAQIAKPSDWDDNAPDWVDLSTSNVLKFDMGANSGTKFFKQLILNTGEAKANYSNGEKIWVMNSKTKTEILAEALTFNATGALVAGMNNTMPVIGGEIIELEFIPDGDVFFGYSSLYLLVERAGGTFAVADQVRFIEDQTVFKGTARYDGAPVFGQAFVLQNIKNLAPKTSIAFAQDKANTEQGAA